MKILSFILGGLLGAVLLSGAVLFYLFQGQEASPPPAKVLDRAKSTASVPEEDFTYKFKGRVHLPAALKEQAPPTGRLYFALLYVQGQKQIRIQRGRVKAPKYPVEFDLTVPSSALRRIHFSGRPGYFQVTAWHCEFDAICAPSLYGQKIFASHGQPKKNEDFFSAGPSIEVGDMYIDSLLIEQQVPGCPGPNRSMSGTISPYPPSAEVSDASLRRVLIAYPLFKNTGRTQMFGYLTDLKEIYVQPINSKGPTRFNFPNLPANRFYYATHVFNCGASDNDEICVKKFVSSMQEGGNPLKKNPFTVSSDFQFMRCGSSDLKHYYYSGALTMPGPNAPEFIRARVGNLN